MCILSVLYLFYAVFHFNHHLNRLIFTKKSVIFLLCDRLSLHRLWFSACASECQHSPTLLVSCHLRPFLRIILYYSANNIRFVLFGSLISTRFYFLFSVKESRFPFSLLYLSPPYFIVISLYFSDSDFIFPSETKSVYPSSHPFPLSVGANIVRPPFLRHLSLTGTISTSPRPRRGGFHIRPRHLPFSAIHPHQTTATPPYTQRSSFRRRGAPACAPAAQTTAALFREGYSRGKRARAHT